MVNRNLLMSAVKHDVWEYWGISFCLESGHPGSRYLTQRYMSKVVRFSYLLL